MKYLLDTNIWIKSLNQSSSAIKHAFEICTPTDIVLCSVVKAELYYGVYKSTHTVANLQLLEKLFAQFISLPFTDIAAEIAGNLRSQLTKLGTPIGPNDLQIAAIALANNLILVTHNTGEFSRIIGLRWEDWEV
ncbi:type II toxin-antitoxin system VapC family toxin [soil metagenome]